MEEANTSTASFMQPVPYRVRWEVKINIDYEEQIKREVIRCINKMLNGY